MTKIPTPELEKLSKVHEESQTIGAFLEWFADQGYVACKWGTPREGRRCTGVTRDFLDRDNCEGGGIALRTVRTYADPSLPREERESSRRTLIEAGDTCTRCHGTGWEEYDGPEQYLPVGGSIEVRLAEYYGIDLDKVEAERRALLDEIRANA